MAMPKAIISHEGGTSVQKFFTSKFFRRNAMAYVMSHKQASSETNFESGKNVFAFDIPNSFLETQQIAFTLACYVSMRFRETIFTAKVGEDKVLIRDGIVMRSDK